MNERRNGPRGWHRLVLWWGGRSLPSALVVGFIIVTVAAIASRTSETGGVPAWIDRLPIVVALVLALSYIPCRLLVGYAVREGMRRTAAQAAAPTPVDSVKCSLVDNDSTSDLHLFYNRTMGQLDVVAFPDTPGPGTNVAWADPHITFTTQLDDNLVRDNEEKIIGWSLSDTDVFTVASWDTGVEVVDFSSAHFLAELPDVLGQVRQWPHDALRHVLGQP